MTQRGMAGTFFTSHGRPDSGLPGQASALAGTSPQQGYHRWLRRWAFSQDGVRTVDPWTGGRFGSVSGRPPAGTRRRSRPARGMGSSGCRSARVITERQVTLVFLCGVQPEDRVQPVEEAAQVGEVSVVGVGGADVGDQLAEAPDLVGDLGVRSAHGGCRLGSWWLSARLMVAVGSLPPRTRSRAG